MKILYIGVHSHDGWGAEYWLTQAFSDLQIGLETIDYRKELKIKSDLELKEIIHNKCEDCDLVFLQRGDQLSPNIFYNITIPIIFWSTEPLQLKTDVDTLLQSDIFTWVFVHSYSCLERINGEFSHLSAKTSVMHNAAPREIINFNKQSWIKLFIKNGYRIIDIKKGPITSGYGLNFNRIRYFFRYIGLTSEHIYYIKVNDG